MALQILMLGSGLNLSCGGMPWRELVMIIATQPADKVERIQNTDILCQFIFLSMTANV